MDGSEPDRARRWPSTATTKGRKKTLAVTPEEERVATHWPRPLLKKSKGCDFVERDGGALVEVKSSEGLEHSQFMEMIEATKKGKAAYVVMVREQGVLIFKLASFVPPTMGEPMQVGASQSGPHNSVTVTSPAARDLDVQTDNLEAALDPLEKRVQNIERAVAELLSHITKTTQIVQGGVRPVEEPPYAPPPPDLQDPSYQ